MSSAPVPGDPGRDEDPAWPDDDPVTPADREAWLDHLCELDDPFDDPEQYPDPESCVPPGQDELTAEELAGIREAAADQMLALDAASTGRRGPGHRGSARTFPGESASRAAGFGTGMPWDVTAGCAQLAVAADAAAGDGMADRFDGTADHELIGLVCAWDRLEAHMAARKLAAIAEVFRRNPEDGFEPRPGQMPAVVHEFTRDQLACALGESRGQADTLLTVAWHLATRLTATLDALRDGAISRSKAELIVWATQHLDGDEARAAEAKVLGRAGRLTPGGLRAAVARAVMQVAPGKARKRREDAARDARVQRWAEDSGNAALMGRELPPDQVLAADQRISWWARMLKKAGLEGDMDVLRARAYLDLLLGKDSRPRDPQPAAADTTGQPAATGPAGSGSGPAASGTGPADSGSGPAASGSGSGPAGSGPGGSSAGGGDAAGAHQPPGAGPAGRAPAGFAGRVTLTVPLATVEDRDDRPGEIPGIGPVDPWLARDLANAAAASPRTTWCVTVTDQHGHAIGHGCARPAPGSHRRQREKQHSPGARAGPGFALTALGDPGPPGGYGTWRLRIPGDSADLIVTLDPLTTQHCDHRFAANGHDPGVRLRHLSQIRHATCTSPVCRRPAGQCDFEHNTPYEAGGRTCLCNGGPKCRHDHRLKQQPGWKVDQLPDGTFRWTTPSGRSYDTEATRYPT